MAKARAFFGGVPTDPEINRLKAHFPPGDLFEGRIITHDQVAEIIHAPYGSSRYKTVTTRWRNQVTRNYGIMVGSVAGVGFKILNDAEKVDQQARHLKSSLVQNGKSFLVASTVDEGNLTAQKRKEYEHYLLRSIAVQQAIQLKSKAQLPSLRGRKEKPNKEEESK